MPMIHAQETCTKNHTHQCCRGPDLPILDPQGSINVLEPPNNNSFPEFHHTFKHNINISQFCLLNNTRHQYHEMLYFYLRMHQHAFGGLALPGPTGGAYTYSAPQTSSWTKKGGERERGGEKREGMK